MVVAAWRGDAFVGVTLRPGDRMVEVGVVGAGAAAGRGAGGGAGADQVPELAAGRVPLLTMPMMAGSFGDRRPGDVQRAQQFGELCPLVIVGSGRRWPGGAGAGGARPGGAGGCGGWRWCGGPAMGPAGAAVRDRGTVRADCRYAPSSARVLRGGLQQAAGVPGVEQPPPAGLAGGGGPAEGRAGRDQEVDQRGEWRRIAVGIAGAGRGSGGAAGGRAVAAVVARIAGAGAGAGAVAAGAAIGGTAGRGLGITGCGRAGGGRGGSG
jgi:hypothetical protein